MAEAVGFLAAILSTLGLLPQLLKSWQSRSTKDLSLGWLIVACIAALLWLIYGFLIEALPILLANLVTLVLISAILVLKLRYG